MTDHVIVCGASGTGAYIVDELIAARRAIPVTIAGVSRVAAIEDAGRLRDALGLWRGPPGIGR